MSTADELSKFDALRQSGALSQEEFDAEKAKLLVGVVVSSAANLSQPSRAEAPQHEGWWQGSDGKWYAPEFQAPPTLSSDVSASALDSSSSSQVRPESRRTKPVILASVGAVVVAAVAMVLVVSLGASANSPSSVATTFTASLTRGHPEAVCSAVLPSQQVACASALKGLAGTTKNLGIGHVQIEGDQALVVTTGSYCDAAGHGCQSNSDPNLGFDNGHSFRTLWADATGTAAVFSSQVLNLEEFIVPTQKEGGKWYVTIQSSSSSPPSPTGGGSNQNNTAAQSNLQTALTGAKAYYTNSNQTYGTSAALVTGEVGVGTGLTYQTAVSTGNKIISVGATTDATGALLTNYSPGTTECWGILDLTATETTAVLGETAVGTYFWVQKSATATTCVAATDLASAVALTNMTIQSTGFPTG